MAFLEPLREWRSQVNNQPLCISGERQVLLGRKRTPRKLLRIFSHTFLMSCYRPSVASMKIYPVHKGICINLFASTNSSRYFQRLGRISILSYLSVAWGIRKVATAKLYLLSLLCNRSLDLHGEEQQNCHFRELEKTLCSWRKQKCFFFLF